MPSLQPAPRYECLYIPTQQLCAALLCISPTSSVRGFYLRRRNNSSPRLPPPSSPVSGWLAPALIILLVIPSLANHLVNHLIGGFLIPPCLLHRFPHLLLPCQFHISLPCSLLAFHHFVGQRCCCTRRAHRCRIFDLWIILISDL